MTNPTITLTRFKQAHKAAPAVNYCELPIYGDLDLETGMDGLIELQRGTAGEPGWWGFSHYTSVHRHEAITHTSAVVLEYDADSADEVRRAAQDIAWFNYVVETETKTGNTIAVIFPLAQPITDTKTYSRVATILAVGMDCYRMTHGCGAVTFLIQPRPFAKVETNDGIVVDAAERFATYQGQWFEIEKFEGEPTSRLPANIRDVQRASAKAAQLDPPTNSDLFDWS